MNTPSAAGLVMPAEWERHARCWMAWPCRLDLWGDGLDAARSAYAEVARTIAEFEPVTMVCNPADVAEASLASGAGVDVMSMPIDDSWMRDTGPTFVVDHEGALAAIDWRFNGWGNLYGDYENDADLARRIIEHVGAWRYDAPVVLEGGAIDVDGEGTLLTTEQCLLDPNRNPGVSRSEMERHLKDHLGVGTVIWLDRGYEDDETAGHIDEIACFARPGVVLALATDDRQDGNHPVFQDNLARLRDARDAHGRRLEVIELPLPKRRDNADGRRITLSYANFYIANGGVVMPGFEVAADDRAFKILRDVFPDRRVIQVAASDIVVGGGGIHCITQQQPAPGPAADHDVQ